MVNNCSVPCANMDVVLLDLTIHRHNAATMKFISIKQVKGVIPMYEQPPNSYLSQTKCESISAKMLLRKSYLRRIFFESRNKNKTI